MKGAGISARGCVYNTNYHFVWSTKYRRKVLTGKIAEDLKELHEKIAEEKGSLNQKSTQKCILYIIDGLERKWNNMEHDLTKLIASEGRKPGCFSARIARQLPNTTLFLC